MSKLVSNNSASIIAGRTKKPYFFQHQLAMRPGKLYPIWYDMLMEPGSTKVLDIDAVHRALALKNAQFGQLEVTYDAYFVPWRIIFDKTKQLFGENDSSAWTVKYDVLLPHEPWQDASNAGYGSYVYSLGCYLGLPYMDQPSSKTIISGVNGVSSFECSLTLAKRAYLAIWNYYFRNPNVSDPILFSLGENGGSAYDSFTLDGNGSVGDGELLPVMKKYDVLTGLTPNTQKGPQVTIPLGSLAKVGTLTTAGTAANPDVPSSTWVSGTTYADLSSATGANVSDMRRAIAVQHFYERLVKAPHYGDICEAIYGVRASSPVLDEPEFVGTFTENLSMQTVTSTSNASGATLGFQGAKSETAVHGHLCSYTAKEHGVLMIVAYIRQKNHIYANFLPKAAMLNDLWDLYNPMFAGTGDVPVSSLNIYVDPIYGVSLDAANVSSLTQNAEDGRTAWYDFSKVLGYQQYGWFYDYPVSMATGHLNPYYSGSDALTTFSSADKFAATPSLNEALETENPSLSLDRNSVTGQVLFVSDVIVSGSSIRVAPPSVPGLTRL